MQDPEHHPFSHYIPPNAKTLIIGTFPPVRKHWSFEFFYPNKRNLMWRILGAIAGIEPQDEGAAAIESRKAILIRLKAGITDMGKTIRRVKGNSLDENLELVELMHILQLLDAHPSITQLVVTSSSGPVSALRWLSMHLHTNAIAHVIPKGKKPLSFSFEHGGKTFPVHVLYSPSPRAANRISFDGMIGMYRKYLLA